MTLMGKNLDRLDFFDVILHPQPWLLKNPEMGTLRLFSNAKQRLFVDDRRFGLRAGGVEG